MWLKLKYYINNKFRENNMKRCILNENRNIIFLCNQVLLLSDSSLLHNFPIYIVDQIGELTDGYLLSMQHSYVERDNSIQYYDNLLIKDLDDYNRYSFDFVNFVDLESKIYNMILHSSINYSKNYNDYHDGKNLLLLDNSFFNGQSVLDVYLNSCHRGIMGDFHVYFNDIISADKILGVVGEVDYIKGGIICIGNRLCIYYYGKFNMVDIKGYL